MIMLPNPPAPQRAQHPKPPPMPPPPGPPVPTVEKMVLPSECAKILGISTAMVSAVKKMSGILRKKVFPSEIESYLKEHPEFTISVAYPSKKSA